MLYINKLSKTKMNKLYINKLSKTKMNKLSILQVFP
jgi:hypothetical protein